MHVLVCAFFFFNDTATTEIYTLSLHALFRSQRPMQKQRRKVGRGGCSWACPVRNAGFTCAAWKRIVRAAGGDRKSTRLNSSHGYISYAVFCLKKKKTSSPPTR